MVLAAVVNLSMENFITHAPMVFMMALAIFTGALLLKSVKLFLLELVLFLMMFGLNMSMDIAPGIPVILGIIEGLLVIFVVYKLYRAVHYNYQLVLEKIHRAPRELTRNGDNGSRKSFL